MTRVATIVFANVSTRIANPLVTLIAKGLRNPISDKRLSPYLSKGSKKIMVEM